MRKFTIGIVGASLALLTVFSGSIPAQRKRARALRLPGGTNPDGSLRPTPPLTRLFTQDAYTEYSLLAPGSEHFRRRFNPE